MKHSPIRAIKSGISLYFIAPNIVIAEMPRPAHIE